MTLINTPDECLDLANKIAKYAIATPFKPFEFKAEFDKTRSSDQNRYYFGVVVDSQVKHFKNDPFMFVKWLMEIAKSGIITPDLIHELNKILYNGNKSTTKLSTRNFIDVFCNAIREDMLHYGELHIDLPPDNLTTIEENHEKPD